MDKYHLYVDMDGVLADFDKYVTDANGGVHPNDDGTSVWRHIHPGSFANFPKMEDADQLWDFVMYHSPTILTATGHSVGTAGEEKKEWAREHFGHDATITVRDGADKINIIEPKNIPISILIDDRAKAIDPWVAAGGIGILHTSAADSINQLIVYLEDL